uniref:Uncharacterized protein n=1 Tax=Anguilla anguilla TaxID=7936 RepID=A0A0E9W4D6_ANGAN
MHIRSDTKRRARPGAWGTFTRCVNSFSLALSVLCWCPARFLCGFCLSCFGSVFGEA